jgi:tRNA-Thr(GGU) m(6)t(6)A37 methyltransferase TsaA
LSAANAFEPIGVIHSCFKEKFGIPRQPGLAPAAEAQLQLFPPWNRDEAVRGLAGFSHLWVIFLFHAAAAERVRATVRPPRLGGNQRIGVFASRSPFRPNPIGLSAVRLKRIEHTAQGVSLLLSGVDLLDGTPVLDIKPYVPYADAIDEAVGGFANEAPDKTIEISYSEQAENCLRRLPAAERQSLEPLLRQVLQNDPRPAYSAARLEPKSFGMRLLRYNVRWTAQAQRALVTDIEQAD